LTGPCRAVSREETTIACRLRRTGPDNDAERICLGCNSGPEALRCRKCHLPPPHRERRLHTVMCRRRDRSDHAPLLVAALTVWQSESRDRLLNRF
jgi:hypothetical protein